MKPRQPLSEQVPISADASLGDESGHVSYVASRFGEAICFSTRKVSSLSPAVESLIMEIGETLYVTTHREFRRWLREHHVHRAEIRLVRYKKTSGERSLDYVAAVEEAICHGWIDYTEKSVDFECFALRFSPRRTRSHWSPTCPRRARRMIEKKMTKTGLAALPEGPVTLRRSGGA